MVEVIVVGAGPVGMVLAADLHRCGVDVEIVEARPTAELAGSRAGGFHSRTLEIFDQRGIVDRFLRRGRTLPVASTGSLPVPLGDLPTRHPYTLALSQNHIEAILVDWLDELGLPVRRGRRVVGLRQDDTGVELQLADGGTRRAAYVVGTDGGRSTVRRAAGIGFGGWEATTSSLIAEVEVTEPLPEVRFDAHGVHGLSLLPDGRTVRVVSAEATTHDGEPTLADLRAHLVAVFGTDFGVHHPTWISRFSDATRQADAYRQGRVLLAGDAAHTHSPAGGQGIGLGVQDAANLGWKLAQVVRGVSDPALLDSYHAERHPAGARTLQLTMAASALQRREPRMTAVADLLTALLDLDQPTALLGGRLAGLDVAYDLGPGHPLLGRRMPDLDLRTDTGAVRVFDLLRPLRPVVIVVDPSGEVDLGPWSGRVSTVAARHDGPWVLPVIGPVEPPAAVLVRPDGHVAWVGGGTTGGLAAALGTWCGDPAAVR